MSLETLRSFRLDLENPPFFNKESQGIALFDLISTFLAAYILEKYITVYININKNIYYASLIPLGIIIHYVTNQNTFLNSKIFTLNINIYHIFVILTCFIIYKNSLL